MIKGEVRYMYLCILKHNYNVIGVQRSNGMVIVCVSKPGALKWVYLCPRR